MYTLARFGIPAARSPLEDRCVAFPGIVGFGYDQRAAPCNHPDFTATRFHKDLFRGPLINQLLKKYITAIMKLSMSPAIASLLP